MSALKFEAIKKGKFKNGGDWDGRHNCGENYELIRRSESGDRGGDELRRVDRGRHGPGVANAPTVQDRAPSVGFEWSHPSRARRNGHAPRAHDRKGPRHRRRLRSVTTTDEAFSPTVNGATGTSDIEGKVARVSDERVGKRTSFKSAFRVSLSGLRFCLPSIKHHLSRRSPAAAGRRRKPLTSNPPTDGFAVANISASAHVPNS